MFVLKFNKIVLKIINLDFQQDQSRPKICHLPIHDYTSSFQAPQMYYGLHIDAEI
jgi:hypothetical protein